MNDVRQSMWDARSRSRRVVPCYAVDSVAQQIPKVSGSAGERSGRRIEALSPCSEGRYF